MRSAEHYHANVTRLLPSNLGQIVGRGEYSAAPRELSDEHLPAAKPKPKVRTVRGGRAKVIAAVLERHPEGLRARDIAHLAGIESVNIVNAYLSQMPEVEKSGERCSYRYRLKTPTPEKP